jgi:hypothetical protein
MPAAFAQYSFQTPRHGFISEKPASDWEHSLLSGNGTTGIMVAGDPYREVINVSHALLYLPLNITDAKLPQGEHPDEIRTMLLNGEYQKAGQFLNDLRKKAAFSSTSSQNCTGPQAWERCTTPAISSTWTSAEVFRIWLSSVWHTASRGI